VWSKFLSCHWNIRVQTEKTKGQLAALKVIELRSVDETLCLFVAD